MRLTTPDNVLYVIGDELEGFKFVPYVCPEHAKVIITNLGTRPNLEEALFQGLLSVLKSGDHLFWGQEGVTTESSVDPLGLVRRAIGTMLSVAREEGHAHSQDAWGPAHKCLEDLAMLPGMNLKECGVAGCKRLCAQERGIEDFCETCHRYIVSRDVFEPIERGPNEGNLVTFHREWGVERLHPSALPELCKNPTCKSLVGEAPGVWLKGYCPQCIESFAKRETTRLRKLPLA